MNCSCTTYTCLDVPINPCNVGTGLGIIADQTGNYKMYVEFNGNLNVFSVVAVSGQEISVPTTVFNEYYSHEVRIIAPDNSQECYRINTYPSSTISGFEPTPPATSEWQWVTLQVDDVTNELVSEYFAGDVSPMIWVNSQPIEWGMQGVTLDNNTNKMDFTAIGGIQGSLVFQYKLINA